jgi:hypothetical protein
MRHLLAILLLLFPIALSGSVDVQGARLYGAANVNAVTTLFTESFEPNIGTSCTNGDADNDATTQTGTDVDCDDPTGHVGSESMFYGDYTTNESHQVRWDDIFTDITTGTVEIRLTFEIRDRSATPDSGNEYFVRGWLGAGASGWDLRENPNTLTLQIRAGDGGSANESSAHAEDTVYKLCIKYVTDTDYVYLYRDAHPAGTYCAGSLSTASYDGASPEGIDGIQFFKGWTDANSAINYVVDDITIRTY